MDIQGWRESSIVMGRGFQFESDANICEIIFSTKTIQFDDLLLKQDWFVGIGCRLIIASIALCVSLESFKGPQQ